MYYTRVAWGIRHGTKYQIKNTALHQDSESAAALLIGALAHFERHV